MKSNWLIATAAAALLVSGGLAVGQQDAKEFAPGQRGAQQPPGERMQQQQQKTEKGAREFAPGQRDAQQPPGQVQKDRGTVGQQQQQREPRAQEGQKDRPAAQEQRQQKPGAAREDKKPGVTEQRRDETRPGTAQEQRKDTKPGTAQERREQTKPDTAKEGTDKATVGVGTPQLTQEQRTVVRQQVIQSGPRVDRQRLQVELRQGVRIPQTVITQINLAPVPAVLVEINPRWRGYRYIIVEERIVIIRPDTYEIVAVIVV